MQMSDRPHYLPAVFSALVLALLCTVFSPQLLSDTATGSAAGTKTAPQAETAQAAEQQDEPADTPQTGTQTDGQKDTQTPPADAVPTRPIKEFKPSETIGADSAVSFPVDI